MKYIIAIGIFQAACAIIFLLRSKFRNNADGLLVLLVGCIILHLSIKFFIFSFIDDTEVLSMLNTFIGFCYMPLLYLYTLKNSNADFKPISKWYLFIPFIISTIGYFSTISVLIAAPEKGHIVLHWYNTISLWGLLSFSILFTPWIIYLAKKKLVVQSQERKLIIEVAELFFVLGMLGVIFSFIQSSGLTFNYISRSMSYALLIVITIRIMAYKYGIYTGTASQLHEITTKEADITPKISQELALALTAENNSITVGDSDKKESLTIDKLVSPTKRKEVLSQSEMFRVLLKLENAMKVEKHYMDSELNPDKLSKHTGVNKHHISETLNHFIHKSFYNFVNEYRIQHVKDRLEYLSSHNIEVNILELAYEAGFNSKSSFNRCFKEITSQTPTAYFNTIPKNVQISSN